MVLSAPITHRQCEDRATVLIAGDHALMRAGLAAALASETNLEVCGEAQSLGGTLELLEQLDPDLLILDVSLKNGMGFGMIKACHQQKPALKILVLSLHEEWLYAGHALKAGAQGYLNRFATPEMVVDGVQHLLAGQVYLTPELTRQMISHSVNGDGAHFDPITTLTVRELEVFELIGQGHTVQRIARSLKLSPHTVESYRERVKVKLDLTSGAELTFRAIVWVLMRD